MTILLPSLRRLRGALHVVTAMGLAFGLLSARNLRAAELDGAEPSAASEDSTLLLADELVTDETGNIVTATGAVEIQRGNLLMLADKIVYDRRGDVATATGHVAILESNGSVFFFESIQVTGDLKEGLAQEVRVLLSDKSRLASRAFRRIPGGVNELYSAVYTACDSCADENPLWQLKAGRVQYDADAEMVYYRNAWLEFGGIPVFYTPYLAHPDPTAGPKSGLLLPTIGAGRNLGLSYQQPYYIHLSDTRDATITPFLTTSAGKGAIGEYRQNFKKGQMRLFGSLMTGDPGSDEDVRGHIKSWARWDINQHWRSGTDINLATDRTYLRRYGFDAPTWLTTNVFAERFSQSTYFSANTYYFQRQRIPLTNNSVPLVTPLLTYNYTSTPDSWGGYWTVDGNGLVLVRERGTDTSRLSSRVGWNLPYTSPLGDVYTFRAGVRGDGYYVRDQFRPTTNDSFTGTTGRMIPEASLEWRMPFISNEYGFQQMFEPIVLAAVSPIGVNPEKIPNEDSLDLEFDDTNLFSMQRFAGLDRVETGARVNYGLKWSGFRQNGGSMSVLLGQVYRFHDDAIFSQLSGLRGHFSDIVGRVDFTPNPYVDMQYRFRLDKNSLVSRRSEVSLATGTDPFRIGGTYVFVTSDGTLPGIPNNTEELYLSASSKLNRNWSLVVGHRHNLSAGGGPIRTDVGITYEDECFILGFDIANDRTQDRDFKRGVAVMFRINLKTIGDLRFNTEVNSPR